jgi:hypothetical protein
MVGAWPRAGHATAINKMASALWEETDLGKDMSIV